MNPPPDTLASRRPRALLTATAGLLLTLVVAVALTGGRPLGLDQAVEAIIEPWRNEGTRRVALVFSQLGAGAVLYPALALQAWQARSRGWRTALLPLAILCLAQTLSVVLLAPVSRPGLGETGFDLSSGRTSAAVLGWGLLAAGYGLSTRRACVLGMGVGGVVGFSRLLLSQHWATDVLAGLGLGLLVLLVVTPRLQRPVPGINRDAGRRRRPASGWQHRRWAWTLPAFAALVPLVPPLFEPASHRLIDLAVYVGSGGVAGIGSDVYAYRTPQGLPFTYPPFAALLAEPLSRMPLLLVQIGWTAATLVALVAVARIAMRPVTARLGLAPTVALLLISNPVRSHLRFGQIGIFLVLLVALDLLREPPVHRRWFGAGVGLAAALKLTPAVYLPWLLVTASRERVRGTMLWAVGATLAGLLLLWPSSPTWLGSALWDSSRFGGKRLARQPIRTRHAAALRPARAGRRKSVAAGRAPAACRRNLRGCAARTCRPAAGCGRHACGHVGGGLPHLLATPPGLADPAPVGIGRRRATPARHRLGRIADTAGHDGRNDARHPCGRGAHRQPVRAIGCRRRAAAASAVAAPCARSSGGAQPGSACRASAVSRLTARRYFLR